MKNEEYLLREMEAHAGVLSATRAAAPEVFGQIVTACTESLQHGGKLVFFGNGGSAADAQHLATELVVRYSRNRRAIPAIALTTDTSALTAIGNDFGFADLYARQVEALCRSGDVAIGISTSGKSENVLRGLATAKSLGATTVGFTGGDGGRLAGSVDLALIVPSNVTARIQEMHILLGHVLCEILENTLAERERE